MSPALAGGFLTTAPPGKPALETFLINFNCSCFLIVALATFYLEDSFLQQIIQRTALLLPHAGRCDLEIIILPIWALVFSSAK